MPAPSPPLPLQRSAADDLGPLVLTFNGGSASVRFGVFSVREDKFICFGRMDEQGAGRRIFSSLDASGAASAPLRVLASGPRATAAFLIGWLAQQPFFPAITSVGHRVVHGMRHAKPTRITQRLVAELRRLIPYDAVHMPLTLELIHAGQERLPGIPQVACFDTAFHRTMPRVAKLLPIPRRFQGKGVERYGFHGLSYTFLMEELLRLGDRAAVRGRVILAHLGQGASLAAVRDGRCIDTSMGFSPVSGLMMGTRSGDLDPGVMSYLTRTRHLTLAQFEHMVNHDSGLVGVSGISADVRELLRCEGKEKSAAEALALFCYQVKKWLGAFTTVLGGLDTLVFAGGIGENAATIRERICADLGFLGVKLHRGRNSRSAAVISAARSAVTIRVIRTNEELMIARSVLRVLRRRLPRE